MVFFQVFVINFRCRLRSIDTKNANQRSSPSVGAYDQEQLGFVHPKGKQFLLSLETIITPKSSLPQNRGQTPNFQKKTEFEMIGLTTTNKPMKTIRPRPMTRGMADSWGLAQKRAQFFRLGLTMIQDNVSKKNFNEGTTCRVHSNDGPWLAAKSGGFPKTIPHRKTLEIFSYVWKRSGATRTRWGKGLVCVAAVGVANNMSHREAV